MELSQQDDLCQQDIPKVHGALELYFFARWFLRTDKKEANIEQPVVAASGVDLTAGEVKELKACASFDNVRYGTLDSKVELVRRSVM